MGQEPVPQWGPGRYAADRELGLAASVNGGATPIGDRSPDPRLAPETAPPSENADDGLDWRILREYLANPSVASLREAVRQTPERCPTSAGILSG